MKVNFTGMIVRQNDSWALTTRMSRDLFQEIRSYIRIDLFDAANGTGNQRSPKPSRVKDLANYLSGPTARILNNVILNFRSEAGQLKFKPISVDANYGEVEVNLALGDLFMPDGSHRVEGYKEVIEDWLADEDGREFDLPVTLVNLSAQEEGEQFTIINSNAVAPKGDLRDMMNMRIDAQGDSYQNLPIANRRNIPALTRAYELALILNEEGQGRFKGNVLRDRIILPEGKQQGYFKIKSFADSCAKIVANKDDFFPDARYSQAIMVSEFWKAVFRVIPEAFENPKNFLVLKGLGLRTFNRLLFLLISQQEDPISWARATSDFFEASLYRMGKYITPAFWVSGGGNKQRGGSYTGSDSLAEDMIKLHNRNYLRECA